MATERLKSQSEWIVHDLLHSDPFTKLVLCKEMLMNEDDTSDRIRSYIQEIHFVLLLTSRKGDEDELYTNVPNVCLHKIFIASAHVLSWDIMGKVKIDFYCSYYDKSCTEMFLK